MSEQLPEDPKVRLRAVRVGGIFGQYYHIQERRWWGWKDIGHAADSEEARSRLEWHSKQPRVIEP